MLVAAGDRSFTRVPLQTDDDPPIECMGIEIALLGARPFGAMSMDTDPSLFDASVHECPGYRTGPILGQAQVEFRLAAGIRVSVQPDVEIGIAA